MRLLLDAGADADMGRVELDEASPLHQAARGGSQSSTDALLSTGADPNKQNLRGFTPLHLAALYGHPDVAGRLLAGGVDPAIRSADPNPWLGEYSAMDYAVERDQRAVADTLLAWHRDHTPAGSADALALAALRGEASICRLSSSETDPNAPSTPGPTPLALAARWGRFDAARCLIAAGADPDRRSLDRFGMTPLMHAARANGAEMVVLLLESGADADTRDRYGSTALWWAAREGASDAADVLLAAQADRTTRGLDRQTAADIAEARGHRTLARRVAPDVALNDQ